ARNVGRLHKLEIGGDVVLEEMIESRNGHRQLLDTDLRQPLLHRRQCQCVYDLVVQLVDDGAWRLRWQVGSGIERIDRISLESGFDQRRHIWQRGGALRCADRERLKLAVSDGTDGGGPRRNAEVNAPGDRVGQPLGTLEWNMLRRNSGTDGEPNCSEVRRGPDADGRIVQLTGLGLRSSDQLGQRVVTPDR